MVVVRGVLCIQCICMRIRIQKKKKHKTAPHTIFFLRGGGVQFTHTYCINDDYADDGEMQWGLEKLVNYIYVNIYLYPPLWWSSLIHCYYLSAAIGYHPKSRNIKIIVAITKILCTRRKFRKQIVVLINNLIWIVFNFMDQNLLNQWIFSRISL
jgi:hypothetical protein